MAKKNCINCHQWFETKVKENTPEYARRKACSRACMGMSNRVSLIGKQNGRLTVIDEYTSPKGKVIICQCSCGEVKELQAITVFNLTKERTTKSCGCLNRERALPDAHPKFLNSWAGMKARSGYPHLFGDAYKNVDMEKDWRNAKVFFKEMYPSFLTHIAEHGDDVSIDRIDNSKGYVRGNCRWATDQMQARNRTFVHLVKTDKYGVLPAYRYEELTGEKILHRIYTHKKLPVHMEYVGRQGD